MRIEVTKRALRDAVRLGRWWLANRDKAPDLFEHELAAAFSLIERDWGVGQTYVLLRGRRYSAC